MVDHDPLIRAAAEYLEIVDHEDNSDLYAAPLRNPTVYRVDGDLDLAGLVRAIMGVRKSIVYHAFQQSEAIIEKARAWEAYTRMGTEDPEQNIDAAWVREHLDTLRPIFDELPDV